jgi:hypothetical protein
MVEATFEFIPWHLPGGTEKKENLNRDIHSLNSHFSIVPPECKAGVLSVSMAI